MADVQILYAEGINSVNTTTTPQTVASIPDTSFTASKKYLILAKAWIRTSSGSGNVECRLAHGTTPTVFADNPISAELTANAQESEWAFAVIFDQPSTREQIVLQFNRNAEFTGTVTCELGQIVAINLDDVGSENTHWFQNVDLTDYTTTSSKVSKASITFTPNGGDVYWALGYGIFSGVATNSNHLMDLNDSVAGVLSAVDVEGEDATNDKKAYLLSAPYVPSNASHTLSVRFSHESSAHTVLQNAVYLINLTAVFAQVAYQYTAAQQQPAASPTWTTTATASVTPTTTGNFLIFGHYDNDVGTLTDDVATRLQHNNSGSYVSAPAYADSSPGADSWDATDVTCDNEFTLVSLTSGASRTAHLDVTLVAGTTLRVQNRSIIVISVAKASANVVVTPATADASATAVDPTVVKGSVTLAPATADASATAIDPIVVKGSLTLAPATADASATAVDPTVVTGGGGVTITPATADASATAVDPTVVKGSVTLAPATADVSATAIDPIVVKGSLTLTPATADATASAVNPIVVSGSLSLTPATADASATAVDPTVQISGGGIIIAPTSADVTTTALIGAVVQGSLIFAPAFAEVTSAAIDPSVRMSSLVIAAAAAQATATAVDPNVAIVTVQIGEGLAGRTFVVRRGKDAVVSKAGRTIKVKR